MDVEEHEKIKICHLYPDILNLYGDRGNIQVMKNRLVWRGFQVEVSEICVGEELNIEDYDLFFIGGGQDFEQEILLKDLKDGKGEAIKLAIENEKVFLAICGGYQLLGNCYETWDGKRMEFIGALNFLTTGREERIIGDYMFKTDTGITVVAFENHSGRTYLGEGVRPLGEVIRGSGNNGEDRAEGARYKNVWCSYGHGPLLPKNPLLCDEILSAAISAKFPEYEMQPLEDLFENAAHSYMIDRLLKKPR